MTSLSVIVISLNEGESLRRTVDSLLDSLPHSSEIIVSEIIVVDDGSTDQSTGFLSEGYAGITLLRPAGRLGVAGTRNFGASHAKGDVLVFSDAHVAVPPVGLTHGQEVEYHIFATLAKAQTKSS